MDWVLGPSADYQAFAGGVEDDSYSERYNTARVACFDEEPRQGANLRDQPGDAFPD